MSAGLTAKALAVFAKDLRTELRTRYAVNAILLFAISTLAVVSLSVGQASLPPRLLAALFWVIMFFSAMSGLAHSFIREEEAGTSLALKLRAEPLAVYLGKLAFNLVLLLSIAAIVTPLFFMFTDATSTQPGMFALFVFLGVLALCGATTLVGAIIARAAVKGALFAVLSLPILIPIVFLLVSGSAEVLDPESSSGVAMYIQGIVAYVVIMFTGSVMLFRFVWLD